MITVEHLAKAVGEEKMPVLQDIGFQLEPGELVVLLGASGSGKSTLLRCLALKEKWDRGNFRVDGVNILGNVFSANGRSAGSGLIWSKMQSSIRTGLRLRMC